MKQRNSFVCCVIDTHKAIVIVCEDPEVSFGNCKPTEKERRTGYCLDTDMVEVDNLDYQAAH